jgi:hypothetical protein
VRSVSVRISKGVQRRMAYTPSPSQPTKTKTHSRSIIITPNVQNNIKKFKAYHYSTLVQNPVQNKALICARRSQRKNIMHAMGHAGKGGQRRPTNNKYRNLNCKG